MMIDSLHTLRRRSVRLAAAALVTAATTLALAGPAQAHIPVFLTEKNGVLAIGDSPLVVDGTTSVAFYGRTANVADTRAVRIQLQAGQEFHAELLIPDLAPETALQAGQLPRLAIVSPRGQVTLLANNERKPFYEPFTQTSYLTLGERTRVAQAGTYTLVVIGIAPARFVAVTGQVESFTAAIKNATIGTLADVQQWYATPPGRALGSASLAPSALLQAARR
jgi:hypothetical protein